MRVFHNLVRISLTLNLLYMPLCKIFFINLLKILEYICSYKGPFRYKGCELWVGKQINTQYVKKTFCICDEFVKAVE
jgi:hypothetical protein